MGKKDLLKSTSKRKAKKAEKKKAVPKKAAAKKAAPKKAVAKKAAPKKAAPKKTAAKKSAPKQKLTGKALLLEKFDLWQPSKLYTVQPDKKTSNNYTAPPLFDDKSPQDIEKINQLLALHFDIKEIIAKGEKAAAKKAAAEKAAAEKAAAEKAAAEKAAAEKAAAEKAAAEKAAAEKAAAEKTAAEKAAAEKAAAEKAAAEKAAAEKAAAEKKPEIIPETPAPTIPSQDKPEPDPMKKVITTIAAILVLIFTPIILVSFLNTTNYYLQVSDGALELWQGDFAPMGKNMVISMPGAVPPETINEVYSKKEVFPIVSAYLVDKADTLLEINGLPDFQSVQATLSSAKKYAVTKTIRQGIAKRLTSITFISLLYKADVAAESGTVEGRETAVGYLEKAAILELDAYEADMVTKKINALQGIVATKPKK